MRATLTDDQRSLQEVAADLAAAFRPEAPAAGDRLPSDSGATDQLFQGFLGLAVDEALSGMGGGLVDLSLLVSELGRNLVATPFVDHVLALQLALGAELDVSAGLDGTTRWTIGSDESGAGLHGPWQAAPGAEVPKRRVGYADVATSVVATTGHDGVVVASPGDVVPDASTDLGRPTASVRLGPATQGESAGARRGLQRVLALQAAQATGVGRGAIELAVGYANQREQFGQPIGRFQGVAHQLADALVGVENAWSLVLYAAWAIDDGDVDAARSVHAAAASAGEAAVHAAERATQVHGGIGITWEAMPHLYLRRALTLATTYGDTDEHRRLIGSSLLTA